MSNMQERTYEEILEEIEALKEKADIIRQNEIAAVIEDVRAKIKAYNLTARDLGLSVPDTGRAQRAAVVARYRDPASGKTWTGRGVHPNWLKEYVAQGRTKDEFLISK